MDLDELMSTSPIYRDIGSSMMAGPMMMNSMMGGMYGMYGGMGVYPSFGLAPMRTQPNADSFNPSAKAKAKDKSILKKIGIGLGIFAGAILLKKGIKKLFKKFKKKP